MQTLRAYLQLMRFPAVFTAMGDIFLGYLLTHIALDPLPQFGWLLAASSCLYLSGMALNDFFDRDVDAVERPERPIPSGRVSVKAAAWVGFGLMIAGVGFAGYAGSSSLIIALFLAAAILAYDGYFSKRRKGPQVMGVCRFLNVMLGASATFFVWGRPQVYVAMALCVYIMGVTGFACREYSSFGYRVIVAESRWWLGNTAGVMNAGLAGLFACVAVTPGELFWPGADLPSATPAYILLGLTTLWINRHVVQALRKPTPENVQRAVKWSILSLLLLDATLILHKTGRLDLALLTVALLVPSTILARWINIT